MTDAILGTTTTRHGARRRRRASSSGRACRAARSSRSRTAASRSSAAPGAATSRSASRSSRPRSSPSKERELIQQFAASKKSPGARAHPLPAGPLRAPARPVPGLADAAMSSLYLDESLDLGAVDASASTVRARGRRGAPRGDRGAGAAGERIAIGDGRGIVVRGVVTSTGQRELELEVDEVLVEEPPATAHHARAGPREGRPRRARRAGGDRARRRRDRAVGGVAFGLPLGGAEGREGPAALGGDRARGREAVDPLVAARRSRRSRPPRSSPSGSPARGCSCSSRRRRPRSPTSGPTARDLALVVGPEGGIAPAELERLRRRRRANPCGSGHPCCAPRPRVRPRSPC